MDAPIYDANNLTAAVLAIGGLGVASSGLVDSLKALPNGGISTVGLEEILGRVGPLIGEGTGSKEILATLHANWINGVPLQDQKASAKALIKSTLSPDTAQSMAKQLGAPVDVEALRSMSAKLSGQGSELTPGELNALGRFDLALMAYLDCAYNRADQMYRNRAKAMATVFAVVLACVGGMAIGISGWGYAQCVLAGLIAVPIAPMIVFLAAVFARWSSGELHLADRRDRKVTAGGRKSRSGRRPLPPHP